MKTTIFPPAIYNFLQFTNEFGVEKTVLDCGAGGKRPPLALFFNHGYRTFGIDISDSQIDAAHDFAKKHIIELDIRKADMRQIPFDDESFGCVFSWNSSVHLTKDDTKVAIAEMFRVLKKRGLLYVNFIWSKGVDDMDLGIERNKGEFWKTYERREIVHSCFSELEADELLEGFEILYKQKRQAKTKWKNRIRNEAYLDYIARK